MKKKLMTGMLAVLTAVTVALPRPSQAAILTLAAWPNTFGYHSEYFGSGPKGMFKACGLAAVIIGASGGLLGIAMAAGLCGLDENGNPQTYNLTEEDLLNNGYGREEAVHILSENSRFQKQLALKHSALVIEKNETAASLKSAIQSVDSTLSDVYINFLAETYGLN